MFPIFFTALIMAVVSAETSSVNSYSSQPSGLRDYEYQAGGYVAAKPSYSDAGYVSAGSGYAKSDSRYSPADSSGDSADPRASLGSAGAGSGGSSGGSSGGGSSFYKSKYGSEAVVNALPSQPATGHYSSVDYAANAASGSPAGSSADYSSAGSGFSGSYGDRSQEYHQQPAGHGYQSPEYQASRPVYAAYASGPDVVQARPGPGYGPGSGAVSSSLAVAEYGAGSSPGPRQHASYSLPEEYSSSGLLGQGPPAYKAYVMSSGPSGYASKYQSVFGAIKSLFGGGGGGGGSPAMSDASSSASHLAAGSPASYYSPAASHYLASGPGAGLGYAKSYPSMRLVSGYGAGGPGAGSAGKIIVVRESAAGHGSPSYSAAGAAGLASPPGYSLKARLAGFAPSGSGPYVSSAPSSLSYASAPPHSYPGGYSTAAGFGSGHGGSTFLGYSA